MDDGNICIYIYLNSIFLPADIQIQICSHNNILLSNRYPFRNIPLFSLKTSQCFSNLPSCLSRPLVLPTRLKGLHEGLATVTTRKVLRCTCPLTAPLADTYASTHVHPLRNRTDPSTSSQSSHPRVYTHAHTNANTHARTHSPIDSNIRVPAWHVLRKSRNAVSI